MDGKVGKLASDVDETKEEMQAGFKRLEQKIRRVGETVARVEVDHGQKLDALFDGYKHVSGKIDNIEKEVTRHEEIILRRID
ncbi:MAG: hypothetical protein GX887_00910 [Firmicutes bacterium]|nr:hypothetical protein [Bacillota bacterium]